MTHAVLSRIPPTWFGVGLACAVALGCRAPATNASPPAQTAPPRKPSAPAAPERAPARAASPPSDAPAQPATPAAHAPAPPEPLSHLPVVAKLIEAAIAAGNLPGAVVAAGDAHGLRYLEAFGARALVPEREAMTADTIFDLASLTKPLLTATAVMQLVERGQLDLDAPAHRYLPGLRRAGARDIRVRDLLLHTSGLPRVTPKRDFEGPRAQAIRRLLATPLSGRAGQRFDYSDTGYLVLGALVEAVSGQSLADYGPAHIAEPLRLDDTFFGRVPADRRARTAPTEPRDDVMIRGDTHDPRAFRLGGVAGNAGMFSTATDLSRIARALLRGGELGGGRLLDAATVHTMTRPRSAGVAVRAYGWDVLSDYSKLRGQRLGAQAFGHGGFTGTSLWIDPGRDLFVIFLSHRVHPDGTGHALDLIAAVTDALVAHQADFAPRSSVAARATRLGVDQPHLQDALRGRRVAPIVNRASRTRAGVRTLDALSAWPDTHVVRVFTPEHGLSADQEGHITGGTDATTELPIVSLFGRMRRPTAPMLRDLDALVFDLQDVGARFFTYMSTLNELLAASAEHGVSLYVLDRPNPLGAQVVEGPVLDRGAQSFVHYHRLPIRHGMTAGELAQLLNAARRKKAELTVVWMDGYCRELPFEATGLTWTPPSPNLPDLRSVRLYPAVALLEGANVSVGRGTDAPFQLVGAPWLDTEAWLALLQPRLPAGVTLAATRFLPSSGPYRGQTLPGLGLSLADRAPDTVVDLGLLLAASLTESQGARFELAKVDRMLKHRETLAQLATPARALRPTRSHILDLADFLELRAQHLHYPVCAPRP